MRVPERGDHMKASAPFGGGGFYKARGDLFCDNCDKGVFYPWNGKV